MYVNSEREGVTMQTDYLKSLLLNKAEKEQSTFIENLKRQPPDKIIEAAYEKVIRDDLLLTFENSDLSDKQLSALLKLDYPLSACYDAWLHNDCSYMDMLRDTVEDYADGLVKEAAQQKSKNKKHSEPER